MDCSSATAFALSTTKAQGTFPHFPCGVATTASTVAGPAELDDHIHQMSQRSQDTNAIAQ